MWSTSCWKVLNFSLQIWHSSWWFGALALKLNRLFLGSSIVEWLYLNLNKKSRKKNRILKIYNNWMRIIKPNKKLTYGFANANVFCSFWYRMDIYEDDRLNVTSYAFRGYISCERTCSKVYTCIYFLVLE